MASREFLKLMKLARSGDALAQQRIGEIYMLGEQGTPQNTQNALLWLEKASLSVEFNESFFNFVSDNLNLDESLGLAQSLFAWKCIAHAANNGNTQARWVFAQVIVGKSGHAPALAFSTLTEKHWADLGGIDHLKNLALRYLEELSDLPPFESQNLTQKLLSECLMDGCLGIVNESRSKKIVSHLAVDASEMGLASLLSFAKNFDEHLVPALSVHLPTLLAVRKPSAEHQLLYWAAWKYLGNETALKIAAELSYVPAQLALGLRLAKFDAVDIDNGNARLKQAVFWLKQAANQGERDAWYALGVINRMPQYSGYSGKDSDACFDKAADLGHPEAQFKKGVLLWRKRASLNESIVGLQASYWIWHAAQQGVRAAQELLSKIMLSHPNASSNHWVALALAIKSSLNEASHRFTGEMLLMCHRVIIANQLNLNKAELLLANIEAIQHEHGAVVDIREHLPRSNPKLILIETLEQRKALMMASKAFNNIHLDEGNLRQRRYRLEKLTEMLELSQSALQDQTNLT
jgi:TPR repeat protein